MALYGQILISMEIHLGVDLMSTIPLNSTFNSVMIDHVFWNIYKFSSHHGYIFDYSFYQFGSMKIIHWLKERACISFWPQVLSVECRDSCMPAKPLPWSYIPDLSLFFCFLTLRQGLPKGDLELMIFLHQPL